MKAKAMLTLALPRPPLGPHLPKPSSVPRARTGLLRTAKSAKRQRERSSGALTRVIRRLGLWRGEEAVGRQTREGQVAEEGRAERESGVSERPASDTTSTAVDPSLAPIQEDEKITVARAPSLPTVDMHHPVAEQEDEDPSCLKYEPPSPGSWMASSVSAPLYLGGFETPSRGRQRTRPRSLGVFEDMSARSTLSPTSSMLTGDFLRMFDASLSFVTAHSQANITSPDPIATDSPALTAAFVHPEDFAPIGGRSVSVPSEADQSFHTAPSSGMWTPSGVFPSPPADPRVLSLFEAVPFDDASSRHASTYATGPPTPPYSTDSSDSSTSVAVSRRSSWGSGSEEGSSVGCGSTFSYMSMPLSTRQLLESIRLAEAEAQERSFLW
ncbi:hypothetical protein OF83DRAFT_1176005 [Amylostereum chailletii]|nr:hypothetical protein OF83DRAFT_1176005 [Amylostereum chailletii]